MGLVCCEAALSAATDVPAVSALAAAALSERLVGAPAAFSDGLSWTAGCCLVTADLAGAGSDFAGAVLLLCGGGALDVCWWCCEAGGSDAGADDLCSAGSLIVSAVPPFPSAQSGNRDECQHLLPLSCCSLQRCQLCSIFLGISARR